MMHVMRRSGFLFLGGMMLLAAALALGAAWFARPEAALAANGNEPSAWAKDVVHKAYIEGLVPSLLSDYRKPITRVKMSRVIVLLYEKPAAEEAPKPSSNPFQDTKDDSVLRAYALGIVQGTSANTFSLNAPITREQIAVMLANTLEKAGYGDKLT